MIRGLLDSWNRHTKPEAMDSAGATAIDVVIVLGKIVTGYAYGHEEIEILLREAFTQVIVKATERGKTLGAERERETNHALKSAGECVRVAREAERKALRETLRTVFDAECTRGTNPFYAFNEALKAIE